MRIGKLKIALLVVCCAVIAFEIWHLRNGTSSDQQNSPAVTRRHEPLFALLPESEVATFEKQIANPKPHLESWEPTVADINDLEANLPQITALSSKDPDANRHIDHPDQYFRQYLAIISDHKKKIFVNALCNHDGHTSDWRKHLLFAMDGGKCHWHATYDPTTQTFSALEVNGVG